MIFNGIEKDYLIPLTGRRRSAWAPISRDLVTIPGMAGAYLSRTETQIREIVVPVIINAKNIKDLQKIKEDMAEWLVHDEPKELIFKDEPDRVYYAVVDGELELDEIFSTGRGEITFICPDPYKYGPEKTIEPSSDTFTVENEGTAEADPIFELEVLQPVTFAMVSNGEEYNMIGRPAEIEQETVDTKVKILAESGESLDTWMTETTQVDVGEAIGSFATDGIGITVANYGTPIGNRWHGPALMKEITPIQDFEVEMFLDVRTIDADETFRIEFYLFDENMNVLGKMGVKDNGIQTHLKKGVGRIGPELGGTTNYLIHAGNYEYNWDTFNGMVRMRRIGTRFEFYITRTSNRGNHVNSLLQIFNDVNMEYQGRLKFIQIHIGKHVGTEQAYTPRINSIRVFELNEATIDQTPYILYPGDTVIFDHESDDILINGEPRNDLKNFGGSFFKLKKGENIITVTPENSFETRVRFRERYR